MTINEFVTWIDTNMARLQFERDIERKAADRELARLRADSKK